MIKKYKNRFMFIFSQILALIFGVACSESTGKEVALYMAPVALSLSGKVMDSATSNEISNIRVSLIESADTNQTYFTSTNGEYGFYIIEGGAHSLTIAADDTNGGYFTGTTNVELDITNGSTTNIDLYLDRVIK
jgi:hypothetical protein